MTTTGKHEPVHVGDRVPELTLPDSTGASVSLSSFRGHWLVLFFFPWAFSPLCTKEACSFRDEHEAFAHAGAKVVGISADPPAKLATFGRMFNLGYTLLSEADAMPSARERFGVARTLGIFPGRATYVVDPHGIVRVVYVNSVRAKPHMDAALAAIRAQSASDGPR